MGDQGSCLKDMPALAGLKTTTGIYDPIMVFARYAVIPDKPPLEEIQLKDLVVILF